MLLIQRKILYTAPIIVVLCVFGACLACEVFCFSIIAVAVYTFGTDRINEYQKEDTQMILSSIFDFLQGGSDKRLRIISINHALHQSWRDSYQANNKLINFFDHTLKEQGHSGLKQVSYKEMRKNSRYGNQASFVRMLWEAAAEETEWFWDKVGNGDYIDKFFNFIQFLLWVSIVFVFGPILALSKILQISFPWIIVGYLVYHALLLSNEIDLFQMVMLAVYIGLQLLLLLLGVKVFKIHWFLWHINPSSGHVNFSKVGIYDFERDVNGYYGDVCWYPIVEGMVLNAMGKDIGAIIMDYCRSIDLKPVV